MPPIELTRYKLMNPEVNLYAKCYDYGSSSWQFTIIILLIIIVVLIVLTSIYCFYWRKRVKIDSPPKV